MEQAEDVNAHLTQSVFWVGPKSLHVISATDPVIVNIDEARNDQIRSYYGFSIRVWITVTTAYPADIPVPVH